VERLQAAIRDPDPVCILENELLYGVSFPVSDAALDADFMLPIGKAKVMREGTDVTLVAFSKMVCYTRYDPLQPWSQFCTHARVLLSIPHTHMLATPALDRSVCGLQVGYCLEAAEKLSAEGINAEVLNLRSLKPLDRDAILKSVAKTHRFDASVSGRSLL
jgi:pyruvate dehydrogenase E1 component beta subunit